jgi:hypothetical protein
MDLDVGKNAGTDGTGAVSGPGAPGFVADRTRTLAVAWLDRVPVLTERLMTAIFTDNPEWTDYRPVPREDLRDGCARYLTRVLEILSGAVAGPDGDDVAADIGRHRAEQGVPLEGMLRTFRLGGRIVWEALLDQAKAEHVPPADVLEAATSMWIVIDGLSSTLSTSYRNTELMRLRRDDERRQALVEDLLRGRGRDATFAQRSANELGLPVSGDYLVIVAELRSDGTAALAAPEATLAVAGVKSVWRMYADTFVGLVALEHHTAPVVLDRLRPLTRGRVGMSPAVRGLPDVGLAHQLALTALGTVPADTTGLVPLDERYPEALLVQSPELTRRLGGHVLGGLLTCPPRERQLLLETLSAWLDESCSAANAAKRLHCHRNTVLNRLQRVSSLTGRSLYGRRAYVELSLALSALTLPDRTGT